MPNSRFSSVALLAALSQLAPSLAQNNSTANDTSECDSSLLSSAYATVNSTGRTAFHWPESSPNPNSPNGDPWYISVTVVDASKNKTNPSAQSMFRDNYLSVPKDAVYDAVCLLQFESIEAKATGTGKNGCEGAISDTCLEYIRDNMLQSGVNSKACPGPSREPSDKKDEREEECGHFISGSAFTQTHPINSTKQTCPLKDVPGFSPLDNYYSINQGGMGDSPSTTEEGKDLTVYDSLVRRVVPFYISSVVSDGGSFGDGQVVCVTPDDVADGSRVPPEDEEPEKTSAAGSNWKPSALSAVFIAGFVGVFYVM